jgi:hypothetical protein
VKTVVYWGKSDAAANQVRGARPAGLGGPRFYALGCGKACRAAVHECCPFCSLLCCRRWRLRAWRSTPSTISSNSAGRTPLSRVGATGGQQLPLARCSARCGRAPQRARLAPDHPEAAASPLTPAPGPPPRPAVPPKPEDLCTIMCEWG